jgi:hypothetical protein
MNIKYSDWFLVVVLVLIGFMVLLQSLCSGWNEGSMAGSCAVSFMEPIYDVVMGLVLIAAIFGILWMPALLIFFIVFYVWNTRDRIRKFHEEGARSLTRYWFGSLIWILSTVVLISAVLIVMRGPQP